MPSLTQRLSAAQLSFATPEIISIGEESGLLVTIEKQLQGISLGILFPSLDGDARIIALKEYIRAAFELRSVDVGSERFGQILTSPNRIQADSWSRYLTQKAQYQAGLAGERLRADVPEIDHILMQFAHRADQMFGDTREKHLVHGDYIFGNTLFGNEGQLTAVLDFSTHAVVGDTRMDLASAVMFIGKNRDPDGSYTAFALEETSRVCGEDMHAFLEFYRLFYALNFSNCYNDDPGTYTWCLDVFRDR